MNNGSFLRNVVVWMLIGILAIVAIKVGLALAKVAVSLLFFAVFTLGPILFVGWLVLKALRYFTRNGSEATV